MLPFLLTTVALGPWFDDFRTYDEVDGYLDELAAATDAATVLDVGTSIEGREIRGLRISHAAERPALLVVGTQHAREWISPMVTACIADHLVRDDDLDPDVSSLLDRIEVVVVPVVNPDGYAFSWEVDRMWRKNRRPGGGVDLNRNWGTMWGVGTQGVGPSSEIYPGAGAFSEPETMAIADLARSRDVVAFVDYHSPVNLVLIPFAYTSEAGPHEEQQQAWADSVAASISAVHGVQHGVGKPGVGNPSGGLAQDWFAADRDAISFTIELRGGAGGTGFILPAPEIALACEENWAGFLDLAGRVADEFGVDDPGGETGGAEQGTTDPTDPDPDGTTSTGPGDATAGAGTTDGEGSAGSDGSGSTTPFADPSGGDEGCQCTSGPRKPPIGLAALIGVLALWRRFSRYRRERAPRAP